MNQLCIDTLRQFALEGRLGAANKAKGYVYQGCVYRHGMRRCAIGALLEGLTIQADENILDITDLCGLRADIAAHLLTAFDMTADAAQELQNQHDELALRGARPDDFLAWISRLEAQLNHA